MQNFCQVWVGMGEASVKRGWNQNCVSHGCCWVYLPFHVQMQAMGNGRGPFYPGRTSCLNDTTKAWLPLVSLRACCICDQHAAQYPPALKAGGDRLGSKHEQPSPELSDIPQSGSWLLPFPCWDGHANIHPLLLAHLQQLHINIARWSWGARSNTQFALHPGTWGSVLCVVWSFLVVRAVGWWNELPGEVVDAPPPQVLK